MPQSSLPFVDEGAARPLLRVEGALDLWTGEELLRTLSCCDPVDLDLENVELIDSEGVKCLIAALEIHGSRVRSASSRVRRVLRVLGIDRVLLPTTVEGGSSR